MSALYTTKDLKVLRDHSTAEAARILGRPEQSIRAAKRRYLGSSRPHRRFWAEDIAQMMEKMEAGASQKEVAEEFCTTAGSLRQHLLRARTHGFGAYPLREAEEGNTGDATPRRTYGRPTPWN